MVFFNLVIERVFQLSAPLFLETSHPFRNRLDNNKVVVLSKMLIVASYYKIFIIIIILLTIREMANQKAFSMTLEQKLL